MSTFTASPVTLANGSSISQLEDAPLASIIESRVAQIFKKLESGFGRFRSFREAIQYASDQGVSSWKISSVLIEQGYFKEGLDHANTLSEDWEKVAALWNISRGLKYRGEAIAAFVVAEAIPVESTQRKAISEVMPALMRGGNENLEIAREIHNLVKQIKKTNLDPRTRVEELSKIFRKLDPQHPPYWKLTDAVQAARYLGVPFKDICASLLKDLHFKEALGLANTLSLFQDKVDALKIIAEAATRMEDILGTLSVVMELPEKETRTMVFREIFQYLTAKIEDGEMKYSILKEMSRALMQWGHFHEAIAVAEMISHHETSSLVLRDFFHTLILWNHVPEAVLAMTKISDQEIRISTILDLSLVFWNRGDYKGAVEALMMIHDRERQSTPLLFLCQALLLQGRTAEALYVANKIALPEKRTFAILDIARTLQNNGDERGAAAAFQSIPNLEVQKFALRDLCEGLTLKDRGSLAFSIARTILNGEVRKFVREHIAQILNQLEDYTTNAVENAMDIEDDGARGMVLWSLVKDLTRQEKFDRAIIVAGLIPDREMKDLAYQDISESLMRRGDFDEALKVALLIHGNEARQQLIENINKARGK